MRSLIYLQRYGPSSAIAEAIDGLEAQLVRSLPGTNARAPGQPPRLGIVFRGHAPAVEEDRLLGRRQVRAPIRDARRERGLGHARPPTIRCLWDDARAGRVGEHGDRAETAARR